MRVHSCFIFAALAASVSAQRQSPFEPPAAKLQYAYDRTFDLKHVKVTLDVDYASRSIKGFSENTLAPLRSGLTRLTLHAGKDTQVNAVSVNGQSALYSRQEGSLLISVPLTARGKEMVVRVDYVGSNQRGGGFGSGGGWHWIDNDPIDPDRCGFWTQGETEYNREWCPTWDYPNDVATSESIVTVEKGWTVVGNGSLISQKTTGNRTTFHWRMTQPHATYLLSLAAGPFDMGRDKWEGVDLWYVVPRGKGAWIEPSFGDTKDMLTFFSKLLGVKYPWPKYAQNAMYDFGGGMENVSATTLGQGNLTDGKNGFRTMASLNAHELGHQWFGDLVNCKDWGHTWLNESFATLMEMLYMEHSRGKHAYDREVADSTSGYLGEARRYMRPLATRMYANGDAMFDSHSYPKGAVVMHTLRRWLGDEAFFAGLNRYLTEYRHQPVESWQLCRAMTEATGVNCEPFWEQWVYRAGHPVLEYAWRFEDGKLKLDVTQSGKLTYTIPAQVGVFFDSKLQRLPVTLEGEKSSFEFALGQKPSAVILDPDRDFLREMKHTFAPEELATIVAHAPSAVDRQTAFTALAGTEGTDTAFLMRLLDADQGGHPAIPNSRRLVGTPTEAMRDFLRREMKHANFDRQAAAVSALNSLGWKEEDRLAMLALINNQTQTGVVMSILRKLDVTKDKSWFLRATTIDSMNDQVANYAANQLLPAGDPEIMEFAYRQAMGTGASRVTAGLNMLAKTKPTAKSREAIERALTSNANGVLNAALDAAAEQSDKSLRPAVEKLLQRPNLNAGVKTRATETSAKLAGQK